MFPSGPLRLNVERLIIAGFIGLLNIAVITTGLALGQTSTLPSGGVTKVTVGGVKGSAGFPAFGFLSGSPHPVTNMSSRIAANQIL